MDISVTLEILGNNVLLFPLFSFLPLAFGFFLLMASIVLGSVKVKPGIGRLWNIG